MDGNNRWGKKNKSTTYYSYKKGAEKIFKLSEYIFKNYNINTVSAFALSYHNLKRPPKIINNLIKIIDELCNQIINKFNDEFRIKFLGDFNFLPKNIYLKLIQIEKINKNKKKKLVIFLNYSGQIDILNSALKLKNKKNKPSLKNFEKNLSTFSLPNPDLIIRTGGYQRLSDFMLYQISFCDFIFSKKLWPDYQISDLNRNIKEYYKIEKKFGK